MTVRVRLFAWMAQQAQAGMMTLEVPAGCRVSEMPALLQQKLTIAKWPSGTMLAVNREYAPADQLLREGDEVAVIPPVSGG